MAIVFEKIRWKNFLSSGDKFTEVQLNKSPTTLIVGHNGAGKSTMLDAMSFALFGKAHRNIKKDQLVNSINGKGAIVEIEFSIGKSDFKVMRGIKPTKFEVYQNGNLLNQESHAKDYQRQLEQNILKLNHKSFHQIVVLGSSSFIPFMQLPSHIRREVIEDLLDINIFSKMNTILKESNSKIKENLKDTSNQLELIKSKIEVQENYIKDLQNLSNTQRAKRLVDIEEFEKTIKVLEEKNSELATSIIADTDELNTKLQQLNSKRDKLISYKSSIKSNIKSLVSEVKFFEENDTCPTCTQSISEEIKNEKLNDSKDKAKELNKGLSELESNVTSVDESISEITDTIKSVTTVQQEIQQNSLLIGQHRKAVNKLLKENDSGVDEQDVTSAETKLNELKDEKDIATERKLKLLDDRTYNEAMSEMLKDTGIKTKIIKQYLPVMNKMINQYLQVLDFFVSFNINENFEETIKSRYRDEFTYSSFSEGEKMKIDLALLFTWRQIARMKNSISTNLLIMDETFDSSLDDDGIENLEKIINSLDAGTNVFVISHRRDELDSKFQNKIEFTKENNFSEMKEV